MFDIVRVEPGTLAQHQATLRRLTDAWEGACPDAAVLIVTDTGRRWGLGAHAVSGEPVDLEPVPWALIEETTAYFGLGTWTLARRGLRATCIRARVSRTPEPERPDDRP
ncbi:hypothetical protein [Deinococcus multiflagellatus]|uniref:Uncharacterized protein n=1 Tax=Deinococcus multiflagellatus TaxID=1656887 RepID=A0ABW1ZVA1_9DEIO|nr:hypothetical protein [Deinococcus multiflagellatus]MBZ9714498.1 hypothetical protein [Deinococcus multiflagellatus]